MTEEQGESVIKGLVWIVRILGFWTPFIVMMGIGVVTR